MANAYDVMSMAKRQGAEVKAVEEYDKMMDRVRAEEARASKAGMLGKIGGGVGGSIASFLAPAAIGALGIGTGGLGPMLLAGLVGTGISRGGTEIGDMLARQWGMGGGLKFGKEDKEFKAGNVGKMGDVSGPYGQRYVSKLKRSSEEQKKDFSKSISEMLDVENTNRWISSAFSGLSAAGKARAGAESLGTGGQSFKDIMKGDTTIAERAKAALAGDVGEGWKLGGKSSMARFKPLAEYTPPTISPYNLESGQKALLEGRLGATHHDGYLTAGIGQTSKQAPIGQFANPNFHQAAPSFSAIKPSSAFPQYPFEDRSLGQLLTSDSSYSPIDSDSSLSAFDFLESILKPHQNL